MKYTAKMCRIRYSIKCNQMKIWKKIWEIILDLISPKRPISPNSTWSMKFLLQIILSLSRMTSYYQIAVSLRVIIVMSEKIVTNQITIFSDITVMTREWKSLPNDIVRYRAHCTKFFSYQNFISFLRLDFSEVTPKNTIVNFEHTRSTNY